MRLIRWLLTVSKCSVNGYSSESCVDRRRFARSINLFAPESLFKLHLTFYSWFPFLGIDDFPNRVFPILFAHSLLCQNVWNRLSSLSFVYSSGSDGKVPTAGALEKVPTIGSMFPVTLCNCGRNFTTQSFTCWMCLFRNCFHAIILHKHLHRFRENNQTTGVICLLNIQPISAKLFWNTLREKLVESERSTRWQGNLNVFRVFRE